MSSLEKITDILKCFSTERTELSVTFVADRLGLPKSSVSRLMREMARLDFLQRDEETRRYAPGFLLFQLGTLFHLRFDMLDIVERTVRQLVRESGQTGYVGILTEGKIVALRSYMGADPVRYVLEVGRRYPAHTLSFGKALLARRTDAELKALFAAMPEDAPPDPDAFLAEIAEIRRQGWAETEVTSIPGVHGIGVAIVSPLSEQKVGYSLSYRPALLSGEERTALIAQLVESARRIAGITHDPFWLRR